MVSQVMKTCSQDTDVLEETAAGQTHSSFAIPIKDALPLFGQV